MRGVFEAGVLDVFIEKGLRFRKVVGTSAGAMQGMCYMSGQKGRNIRINTTYCNDPRYMGIKHLLREKNYFNFKFMFVRRLQQHTIQYLMHDMFQTKAAVRKTL